MQTKTLNLTKVLLFVMAAVAVLAVTPVSASAATEVVGGDTSAGENQEGWLFNRDTLTSTAYEFNTDESSIGNGAVYAGPITNTNYSGASGNNPNWDKFIAEYFPEIQIADLNSFSYDFMIGSGGDASDENEFYLSVYANFGESDDNNFYDCRYSVVPNTGSTADWTTVTFDPTESYPVTTRGSSPYTCPSVPADMDEDSDGSNIRAFALNMGDTSASDTGLDGYFDNVVLDTVDGETVFDFEPVPTSKRDCLFGGYRDYGYRNSGQCIRAIVHKEIEDRHAKVFDLLDEIHDKVKDKTDHDFDFDFDFDHDNDWGWGNWRGR